MENYRGLLPPYIRMIHGMAFPANPVERYLFYRDDLNEWFIFNGAAWVTLQYVGGLHAPTHENGGIDEIDVAGLNGLLADPQTPLGHGLTHEPGGGDDMAVDAAAGTGSLRTLAGTGVALSAARSDHTHTLLDDISGSALAGTGGGTGAAYFRYTRNIAGGGEHQTTFNLNFAAISRAVGVATAHGLASAANSLKVRLYMGGVQVAESGFLSNVTDNWITVIGFRALVGLQATKGGIHNYGGGIVAFYTYSGVAQTDVVDVHPAAGSIKI